LAPGAPITNSTLDVALWVLLPACGSLLLSAVTIHLSQNVATIPLLWILPLIAYLLSFVLAFTDERWHPRALVLLLGLFGLASAGYRLYRGDLGRPIVPVVVVYCIALFCVCLFCHSEVYRRRPAPARLTTFYFCIAAGGALGAIFVGVVAPLTLSGNYEVAIGLSIAALLGVAATWSYGIPARALCSAAAVALAGLVSKQIRDDRQDMLLRVRNFYGTLDVTQVKDGNYHVPVRTLYHGVIEHGQEVFSTALGHAPTTYYGHPSGVGLALDLCCGNRPRRVGVIGLGTGTLAAYGRPGDVFRFYELNPAVPRIARNYFAYLRDSAARIEIAMGDARVSLANEPPQRFDVLAIDAFSGDAIPVHLLTTQALEVYRRHMAPGGIIAFHVSNRYLNLAPVVQQIADNAGLMTALISSDDDTPHDLYSADWVLVTDNTSFLAQPAVAKAKQAITVPAGLHRWTDDYNSLLPILRTKARDD
jgi:SAM-dependent methyltransferase